MTTPPLMPGEAEGLSIGCAQAAEFDITGEAPETAEYLHSDCPGYVINVLTTSEFDCVCSHHQQEGD